MCTDSPIIHVLFPHKFSVTLTQVNPTSSLNLNNLTNATMIYIVLVVPCDCCTEAEEIVGLTSLSAEYCSSSRGVSVYNGFGSNF